MRVASLSTVLIMGACFAVAGAQQSVVSVGAITKYTGVLTSREDVKDLKEINGFLNSLESQLAGEFVKYPDVEYLDRTNTRTYSKNCTFHRSLRSILPAEPCVASWEGWIFSPLSTLQSQ